MRKVQSTTTLVMVILLEALLISCKDSQKSNITLLDDQIPTNTPLIFAKGIISIDDHVQSSITLNPDMNELFFNRRKPGESHNIYTMKLIDGKWSKPTLAFFSTNKKYLDLHPRFNPSGDRLYFGSTRPLHDSIKSSGLHQWYIEKNESGWSKPIPLLEKLFEDEWIMCVSPAANGNLYFTSKEKQDKLEDEGIYYAINDEGRYNAIEKIGKGINYSGKWIAHPYIAPDESYLIYDAERTSLYENGDLYISFNKNGTWMLSYDLGPKINTKTSEGTATVSPDGKYLFFSRGEEKIEEDGSKYWENNIYWVDFIAFKKELLESRNMN